MARIGVEEIYERHIKPLPVTERLRLIEMAVHDLAIPLTGGEALEHHDWMSVRGIAPNLLRGGDAQEWVSRTRCKADGQREKQWKHKP